jgi:hypothetical protein
MRRYFMILFWVFLTIVPMVQVGAFVSGQTNCSMQHESVSISHTNDEAHTRDMLSSDAVFDATHDDEHCASDFCLVACAAHCMSIAPSQMQLPQIAQSEKFANEWAYKPALSIVAPNTPPPRQA